ncbi:hypothetical protein Goklo_027843, partial [Gossypium klotzschianum]|nr:hypothetical protein [Gossypium klotzschianum]
VKYLSLITDSASNNDPELKYGDVISLCRHDKYGDVAQLLFVKSNDALLRPWYVFGDPTYRCFTFNVVDIVSTIEKYSTLLNYDFRDPLRIYWKQNVDFWGPLANLMGLPVDTIKARLKDKNGPCISWPDIRDAMGKTSGDRHLTLFTFAIYGLIVFPKALGYVSVKLADFLFHIEKWVFVPSTRPIEGFLEGEWPPNQSIEVWVQNLSTLTYQEIEWRALWMIQSTILIGCGGHLWVPLLGIWGIVSYSSLMVLSQYGCDQCVPTTASLNKVEALVQDLRFWNKLEEI